MSIDLLVLPQPVAVQPFLSTTPAIIREAGGHAERRFLEFFAANIRNRNTRAAYVVAVGRFSSWCLVHRLGLKDIQPLHVAAYIEGLEAEVSVPTVKQHLASLKSLFDWLVIGQVIPHNPAASVRGPKHVVKRGKTPVLSATEARTLLDSIDLSNVVGLRDRALIGVMVYTFARVGAVVAMRVEDYFQNGKRGWVRLHEKGGKEHQVPCHHNAEEYLDAYLSALPPRDQKAPLFQSVDSVRRLTGQAMSRSDAFRMVKRRARRAGLPETTCCHTFRATGITAYLANGGTIENAQAIAAHESPRTTKLYDRTSDQITLDEVERILI